MTVQFAGAAAVRRLPLIREDAPTGVLTPPRSIVDSRAALIAGFTVVADLLVIAGAYALARATRVDAWSPDLESLRHFDPVILMTIPGWSLILFLHGLYGRHQLAEPSGEIIRLLHAASLSTVMLVLTAFTFRVQVSRG